METIRPWRYATLAALMTAALILFGADSSSNQVFMLTKAAGCACVWTMWRMCAGLTEQRQHKNHKQ